jgi:hypothetical protein
MASVAPAAKRRRRRQWISLAWWLAICGLLVAFIDVVMTR